MKNEQILLKFLGDLTFSDCGYEFIPTQRGKNLLMINGFTYSQMKLTNNYYCSKKQSGSCKARVKLDDNGKIVSADYTHTHSPPKYIKMSNGTYFKVG